MTRPGGKPVHGLLLFGLMAAASLVPALRIWPLFWLAPLLAYAASVARIPALRASFQPWRFGRVTRTTVAATAIIALGSCAVLTAFHFLVRPDVASYSRGLPVSTFGSALTAGLLFSVCNALLEELVFRGVLFDSIRSEWGVPVAIVATAVLFGYGHMHGYPPGPLGGVLAGIYGLCLGWLRLFTGGLGLPFLAHIVADATIFTLVVKSGGS